MENVNKDILKIVKSLQNGDNYTTTINNKMITFQKLHYATDKDIFISILEKNGIGTPHYSYFTFTLIETIKWLEKEYGIVEPPPQVEKDIQIKTYVSGWHKVNEDKAREYVKYLLGSITNMSGSKRINYINKSMLKGITVEELLKNDKK